MDFMTFLWTTLAVFLTLATFSFLYKDNPFYKIAEHIVVGVSAGYFVIILWHQGLAQKLFQPLSDGSWYLLWFDSSRWYYMFPAILGILMWTRFSKKYQWVSRWPMAMYIGIAVGVSIPAVMDNSVMKQLVASMIDINFSHLLSGPSGSFNLLYPFNGLSQIIITIGSMAALLYFYFSKAHTGAFGKFATLGIWILMIGFGASFGYTVMARISLFINRIQDVDDWGRAAFNSTNKAWTQWYEAVFWLMVAGVLAYIVNEIRLWLRSRNAPQTPEA